MLPDSDEGGRTYDRVNFAPIYEGQATLFEIQRFLETVDYGLAGLTDPVVAPRGLMAGCDAIFLLPAIRNR
jgi:hypothetical protein